MKVCALYSKGPHYLRMLARLRDEYPGAALIAMVPEGYPTEVLQGRCDEVVTVPPARGAASLPGLLRTIRAQGTDVFAIMFHSPRLRVVAGLSGARNTICYTAGNQLFPVRYNFAPEAAAWAARQVTGRVMYARIWWNIKTKKVK